MMEVQRSAAQLWIQDKEDVFSRVIEAVAEDEDAEERMTKKVNEAEQAVALVFKCCFEFSNVGTWSRQYNVVVNKLTTVN